MSPCPDRCPGSGKLENADLHDQMLCQQARFCTDEAPRFPIGMILLAMIAGGGSAFAALISGKSVLVALGLYSGIGILMLGLLCLLVILTDRSDDSGALPQR